MNGRVGGRARKGAGELALLVVDERPDVVVGIGIGCDVDARGASGRRRGRRRRRRLRKGASRLGLGRGLLLGLGLGLRLRLGWRRGALGPALALALVRGETDLQPRYLVVRRLELGRRRRASKGRRVFSAFVVVFELAREGSRVRGLTSSCRVSRTAVSFCCRRIALTMAACFSALTAMSARRRDSLTSARSCEGAEGGGAGVAAQLCFRTTGGREGAVYRTFPLWRASSWLATIRRCWIA